MSKPSDKGWVRGVVRRSALYVQSDYHHVVCMLAASEGASKGSIVERALRAYFRTLPAKARREAMRMVGEMGDGRRRAVSARTIKTNCPVCLEPGKLQAVAFISGAVTVRCPCGFVARVPPGPNPAWEVMMELIGASKDGDSWDPPETEIGGREILGVDTGEAQDVIPADERECP